MFDILERFAIWIQGEKQILVKVEYRCPIHGVVGEGPNDFFRLSIRHPPRCGRCFENLINEFVPELIREEKLIDDERK